MIRRFLNKIIAFINLTLMFVGIFSLQSFAFETVELYSDKEFIVEDFSFVIDINVESIENLVGFQFKVKYLEEFELVKVSLGSDFTEGRFTYNSNSDNNTLTIVYVDVNNRISSDLVTLVSLEFTAPSALESDVIELLSLESSYSSEFVYLSDDYLLTKNNSVSANFQSISKATIGDVNLDGDITLIDVAIIQLHLAKFQILSGINFRVADTNNDNNVDISDAARIQLYLANLIESI